MTHWYVTDFQKNTHEYNYQFLLCMIVSQMETDVSDYSSRNYRHNGPPIQYYLENLTEPYREAVYGHIPPDILQQKILDVPYGFGTDPWSEEDSIDFYTIRSSILDAIYGSSDGCEHL